LELYLNLAEFGPDIFGARAASFYYFGHHPLYVNAAEGAFMALMLPSPRKNHYSIFKNKQLSPSKRRKLKRILADMLHNEFISSRQFRKFVNYDFFSGRKRSIATKRKKRSRRRRRAR